MLIVRVVLISIFEFYELHSVLYRVQFPRFVLALKPSAILYLVQSSSILRHFMLLSYVWSLIIFVKNKNFQKNLKKGKIITYGINIFLISFLKNVWHKKNLGQKLSRLFFGLRSFINNLVKKNFNEFKNHLTLLQSYTRIHIFVIFFDHLLKCIIPSIGLQNKNCTKTLHNLPKTPEILRGHDSVSTHDYCSITNFEKKKKRKTVVGIECLCSKCRKDLKPSVISIFEKK